MDVLQDNAIENSFEESIPQPVSNGKFIEANTEEISFQDMKEKHFVPLFLKDYAPTISQRDFIDYTCMIAEEIFGHPPQTPSIRGSHSIIGRIPEAAGKKAEELEENEKTIYYERVAFIAEIPGITNDLSGQELMLTVGGIKAYNKDNLNSISGAPQRFKVFVGFKVKVCTNLCIWTDGYAGDLMVKDLEELENEIRNLFSRFQLERQISTLSSFSEKQLSGEQFARLIGRAKMYKFLPKDEKLRIPELCIPDRHMPRFIREYYTDPVYGCNDDGSISLWKVYNLMTSTIKSFRIETFLDRNVNAYQFTADLVDALDNDEFNWFLS